MLLSPYRLVTRLLSKIKNGDVLTPKFENIFVVVVFFSFNSRQIREEFFSSFYLKYALQKQLHHSSELFFCN